jgi:hypothetical protein
MGMLLNRIIHFPRFVFIGLALMLSASLPTFAAAPKHTDPIRLPLTFIRSNPVTTIIVGGKAVPAMVDISGGDADGALTLSKELIQDAKGIALGTAVGSDAYGHDFTRPRFRIPVATIGGRDFHDLRAVQEVPQSGGDPELPNAIGKHFLGRYLVVVDYAGGSLTLWPPDAKNPEDMGCGRIRIPMERTEEARLAVSSFDTPAGRVRLLWGATPYSTLTETLVERLRLVTFNREPGSPKFYLSKKFSAAGQDLGPLEFLVLPLQLPKDFDGILGGDFFDRHVVCLDYRRREIRVR